MADCGKLDENKETDITWSLAIKFSRVLFLELH
uniref:Uncharacterized protein n=1 Tax=Daucus carota subsp. sativus TaxID=79200 RepID=A0A165A2K3_DAUCS